MCMALWNALTERIGRWDLNEICLNAIASNQIVKKLSSEILWS